VIARDSDRTQGGHDRPFKFVTVMTGRRRRREYEGLAITALSRAGARVWRLGSDRA
jgi:hypothetical protein